MSNHYHLVITDRDGNLPAFMSWFNEFVAKALNAMHGRWENFWAPGSYSLIRLETPQDVLDRIVYSIANPVRAGLVARCRHWPGAQTWSMRFGVKKSIARPKHYFRANGPLPDEIVFSLERPEGFEDMSDEEWQGLVRERLVEVEEQTHQEFHEKRRSFMGARAALNVLPTDSPSTKEPRRVRNPRLACHDKHLRARAIEELRQFRMAYKQAWDQWMAGNTSVAFPCGTYALRDIVQVQAIPPP